MLAQGRAAGIPLLGDMMSRITGVPIAAGQNLFALFPLVENRSAPKFPVHNQLLELQQVHLEAGYVLLDLRPQNIFFQPGSAKITVIDTGALAGTRIRSAQGPARLMTSTTHAWSWSSSIPRPEEPPREAHGYRDARGIRPIVSWREEVQDLDRNLSQAGGGVEASGRVILERLKDRSYSDCDQFKQDVNTYLEEVLSRDRSLTGFASAPAGLDRGSGLVERRILDPLSVRPGSRVERVCRMNGGAPAPWTIRRHQRRRAKAHAQVQAHSNPDIAIQKRCRGFESSPWPRVDFQP